MHWPFLSLVLLGLLACRPAHAAPTDTELKAFAQDYAHALESADPEKIKPFLDPDYFVNPSASEKAGIDEWFADYKANKFPITEPVWITVNPYPASAPDTIGPPDHKKKWKIRPQYAIGIQSYHSDSHGGEVGGNCVVEGVVEKDGKLYVVRPLPL